MAPHQVSERVEARVRARLGLYKQGAISLLLIVGLAVINWATYRHRWWFLWPALGLAVLWGVRAVAVYNHHRWESLEQRIRQEEQAREERTRQIVDD